MKSQRWRVLRRQGEEGSSWYTSSYESSSSEETGRNWKQYVLVVAKLCFLDACCLNRAYLCCRRSKRVLKKTGQCFVHNGVASLGRVKLRSESGWDNGLEMANSKYEYVKDFEVDDNLLPHTWIVIRIDGRSFTKFSQTHQFEKPNDIKALMLMNDSAVAVVEDLADIVFAYGVSDEYSFVLRKTSTLYQRRASKLISIVCSLFASSYVMNWGKYFPDTKLQSAPAFDGRAVCYPSESILRDYLSWRQVDCHINNQYNTCFWTLVGSGKSTAEAQNILKGTTADVKNNLLFETFNINYNDLPQIFRKGSSIYRKKMEKVVKVERDGKELKRTRSCVVVEHEDIIRDNFWTNYPYILGAK